MINDRHGASFAQNVSRETLARFEVYAGLLQKWNKQINLVSRKSLDDLWARHFLDSAQIWDLRESHQKKWLDLGSGGGFPGAVIAILAAEDGSVDVTLVESDRRKAAFLREVSRHTEARFDVVAERIEELPPMGADVVSARALAPLSELLGHAAVHGSGHVVGIFLKGARVQEEIDEAKKDWHFNCERRTSVTDTSASILKVWGMTRV
ncbi:MAG: 16S rRNA (guanine(527)-N(7))-methyltransferase RsmG [Pseudomonadota bacterium]